MPVEMLQKDCADKGNGAMAEFFARKVPWRYGTHLVGADSASQEVLDRLPDDVDIRIKATVPRDGGYFRFYWKLLAIVRDNLPEGYPMAVETLHEVVKLGAGQTQVVRLANGQVVVIPGSIAWGNMGEAEFRDFMDRAIKYIVSDLIPGMASEALENEVHHMLAGGS